MPVTKVNYMKDTESYFSKKLADYLYLTGKKESKDLEVEAKIQLGKTLLNRGERDQYSGSYPSGFEDASVSVIKKRTTYEKYGIKESFHVLVVKKGTQVPHKVWHYINDGTPNKVPSETYVYPVWTKEARTTPRNLNVGNYKGFGGFRTAVKGRVKKGIKARHFYSTVVMEIRKLMVSGAINKNNLFSISIQTSDD